jgi:type II secretory pathway component PulM
MKIIDWYQTLTDRDRRTVLWGGIAAVLLLLAGGIWKLDAATAAARERVTSKRSDLAWMQAVAPRLRSMPAIRSDESLPLLVDRTAREAGLAGALSGSEPSGNGALRVRLQGASFDALVIWLARLQQERGVVVESANVDGGDSEGLVNASLVLRAASA